MLAKSATQLFIFDYLRSAELSLRRVLVLLSLAFLAAGAAWLVDECESEAQRIAAVMKAKRASMAHPIELTGPAATSESEAAPPHEERHHALSEFIARRYNVSQDVTLFYGTLRENITLGMPYAEDEAIMHAVELAGARSFVDKHPRGFDMMIGERGDSISGGQRQSVAMARALLREPSILVLDEPSSAMDFSTEEALKENLRAYAKHRTLVLVTHRNSMMELVDRLIVIDDGRIALDGPRQKVLEAMKSAPLKRP